MGSNVCKTLMIEDKVSRMTSYAAAVSGPQQAQGISVPDQARQQIGHGFAHQHHESGLVVGPKSLPPTAATATGTTSRQGIGDGSMRSEPARDNRAFSRRPDEGNEWYRSRRREEHKQPTGLAVPSQLTRSESVASLVSNVSRPSGYNEGFRYPPNTRKKNRQRQPVTGTRALNGGSNPFRGAPEPSRDIFVYRAEKGTPSDAISNFMLNNNVTCRSAKKVSNEAAKYDSFRIELKASDISKVLSPEFWPEGVRVRRFFPPKSMHHDNHDIS